MRFAQGHGLGLEYNDPMVADVLRGWSESDEILVQPGMIMELHPNFHTAKLGMTVIGDMVLVTETGNEILTGLPRQLYEI
jgi:Xaa-Pro aminopeptidase